MDDFQLIRFALDNVRVPEIAANAREALDRVIRGRARLDPDSADGRAYERGRRRTNDARSQRYETSPGPRSAMLDGLNSNQTRPGGPGS